MGNSTRTSALSLGSLGSLAAFDELTCGGRTFQPRRICGLVPAVPGESPLDLAREWHDSRGVRLEAPREPGLVGPHPAGLPNLPSQQAASPGLVAARDCPPMPGRSSCRTP